MQFTEWLKAQVSRDDVVGNLAKKMVLDPKWPKGAAIYNDYERHIVDRYYFQDFLDLKTAWTEWEFSNMSVAIDLVDNEHTYIPCSVCRISKPIDTTRSLAIYGGNHLVCEDCDVEDVSRA